MTNLERLSGEELLALHKKATSWLTSDYTEAAFDAWVVANVPDFGHPEKPHEPLSKHRRLYANFDTWLKHHLMPELAKRYAEALKDSKAMDELAARCGEVIEGEPMMIPLKRQLATLVEPSLPNLYAQIAKRKNDEQTD